MNASEVMDEAAVLLNDYNKSIFGYDKLLPLLRKAYNQVEDEFALNSIPLMLEASNATTITAGNTVITSPTDMLFPISIEERAPGGTDKDYRPMDETSWEPLISQTEQLRYWTFREGEIKTVGATSSREVLIRYVKDFPSLNDNNTAIAHRKMKTALAAKTAELASAVVGGATEKTLYLRADYDAAVNRLIAIYVRSLQSLPIRRRPYGVRIR